MNESVAAIFSDKKSKKSGSTSSSRSDGFDVTVKDTLSLELAIQNLSMMGGAGIKIQRNKKKT